MGSGFYNFFILVNSNSKIIKARLLFIPRGFIMQYYFENVFGIMQMMIMMPIAIILVDTFKKNDRTEIISKVITFIILYVALIVINFLP